ncbi:MAG: amylo-alpha-1,6-glucosidase [Acidobacteria bacterium]|nr:amylo-alpha-1,6-glucosidase [Acidobacteriota bacterium]
MDEVNVSQQYYIATKSSPADDRPRVLKYGTIFAVFDRLGDIRPGGLGEQGIFFEGTRYLSELLVHLWNERPLLLSSTIEPNNFLFTADLANLDVSRGNTVVIHRGSLHLLRSKFLWRGSSYEEFKFVNYGMQALSIPMNVSFAADFADIFEVRGMTRERSGRRLEPEIGSDYVVLGCEGLDGVTRRTRIHCEPHPERVIDGEMNFHFELEPKQEMTFWLSVACENSQPARRDVSYPRAMGRAEAEMKALSRSRPRLVSSNSRFNDWVKRSSADVQVMTVGNPESNYPYAGIPWFSTVFGRDGIITALEMLWVEPALAKGVLEFLASTQAIEIDPAREAEPGKILHELRHGEMANLNEIPFARYYGTVDATPLFLMLAEAYYDRTGDRALIEQIWPNLQAGLDWIERYGDVDGDGLVEYAAHGERGLVQQGWKDSNDSVFHADGSLAEPPIALCEVQGYVYAAKLSAARLNRLLGNEHSAALLESQADQLREQFSKVFWLRDLNCYALALDRHKRPCAVRSSNAGHALFTGIARPEHAKALANSLFSHDFYSGWGIRTLASGEARYNPLSYHNGSIWPHDNALIASGLARYGFKNLAGKILMALMDVSSTLELHRLPELFCGLERRSGEGPTLYPVACSPQAWAAAAPFLLIQSCLGLTVEGSKNRVVFNRPSLPEGIPQLSIRGLQIGDACVDLLFERQIDSVRVQVLEKQGEIEVVATL